MPSFSNVAANIKAHHESLNTAYANYYSPRASMPSTPNASRKSSTTSMESQQGERNITKAWKAIKKHHHEMNEAYAAYYSPGSSPASSRVVSTNPTPRASVEEERVKIESGKPRNYQKVWGAIKKRAIEHHHSVNAATAALYGA